MELLTPNINLLRNFNFPRQFAKNIVENTDVKVRKEAGSLVNSGIDTDVQIGDITDKVEDYKIENQKNKKIQERFIDLYI